MNTANEAKILKAISKKHGIPTDDAAIYTEPVRTGRTAVNKLTVNIGGRTFRLIEKCFTDDITELLRYELLRDRGVETVGVYLIDTDDRRLVIEGLSETGICGNAFEELTADGDAYRASLGEVVRAASRFHAAFWDNYDAFGRVGLPWPLESADNYNEHLAGMKRDLCRFTELFPGKLTDDELDCFESAFVYLGDNMPRVIENRFNAGKSITVIHGDLHPGNTFVLRGGNGEVRFIDMEAVRMGLPTDDLAMLLALHSAPGKDSEWYLQQYYDELSKTVEHYSYDELIGDYRLSVAQVMFHPIGVVGVRMNICDTEMLRRAVKSYRELGIGADE